MHAYKQVNMQTNKQLQEYIKKKHTKGENVTQRQEIINILGKKRPRKYHNRNIK